VPIDQLYRFEQFPDAFDRMAKNRHFGKIVLSLA
jgi:NADPH:quinone reductase-like Zn-dependent oxidoreductase